MEFIQQNEGRDWQGVGSGATRNKMYIYHVNCMVGVGVFVVRDDWVGSIFVLMKLRFTFILHIVSSHRRTYRYRNDGNGLGNERNFLVMCSSAVRVRCDVVFFLRTFVCSLLPKFDVQYHVETIRWNFRVNEIVSMGAIWPKCGSYFFYRRIRCVFMEEMGFTWVCWMKWGEGECRGDNSTVWNIEKTRLFCELMK